MNAEVVVVPLDAGEVEHAAYVQPDALVLPSGEIDFEDRAIVCKTTLRGNGRPTLCDCGKVVYKVQPAP